eukprot:2850180-Karenia_brevis.AAC.1
MGLHAVHDGSNATWAAKNSLGKGEMKHALKYTKLQTEPNIPLAATGSPPRVVFLIFYRNRLRYTMILSLPRVVQYPKGRHGLIWLKKVEVRDGC